MSNQVPVKFGSNTVLVAVRSLPGEQQVAGGVPSFEAFEGIEETCRAIYEKLKSIGPDEMSVEVNVAMGAKAGKVLAMFFEPEATAGMKITMTWGKK